MAVDSHSTKILFCEGKPDSLDSLLLSTIVPLGQIRIQSVGSKQSLPSYIQGYWEGQNIDPPPNYIGFRDRDFDRKPPSTPRLLEFHPKRNIWTGYRTTIENYLIDPNLIHEYWQIHAQAPKWQCGPPPSQEEIAAAIRESAEELCDYQAVRWALASLKPGKRWPEIQTTWRDGSGHLPKSFEYKDCLGEARILVEKFHNAVKTVTIEKLEQTAEEYRQKFHNSNFLDNQEYLIWFQGKDHMKNLWPKLCENFSQKSYTQWAAQKINIELHPDLEELVELVSTE